MKMSRSDTSGVGSSFSSNERQYVVDANALSMVYPPVRRKESPVIVLDRCSVSVEEGEFVSLIGPSGCGKSTLLHCIAGLTEITSGTIVTLGDIVDKPRSDVGYMFQRDTLLPWASVLSNVRLPIDAAGRKDRGRCTELLDQVGLANFSDRYPHQLSGGMRQRVQLARLLAQEPRLLLMDEPFGALDAQTKLLVQDQFLSLWESSRITALFVTHDLSEAIRMSDRIILMTNRPSSVKREWYVNLPRPRPGAGELTKDSNYQYLFQDIWQALLDELSDV